MANGDAAAAAGLATFPATQDIRLGYDNDNIRGDELAAHLTTGTHPASAINSGVLDVARIPNIDASKVNTGTFDGSRIAGGNIANIGAVTTANTGSVTTGVLNIKNSAGTNTAQIAGATGAAAFNGNTSVGGTLNVSSAAAFGSSFYAVDIYNSSVSYGAYKSVWVNSDGRLGFVSSNRASKQNISACNMPEDAILGVEVVNYRYKNAVKAMKDNAPVEIGVIAEQLLEIPGMERFVFFNEDGSPSGVYYDRLVLAVIPQLKAQASRLEALEARLTELENK